MKFQSPSAKQPSSKELPTRKVGNFIFSKAFLECENKVLAGKAAKTEETKAAPKSSSARVVPLEKMKAKEGTGKGENELPEAIPFNVVL